MELFDGGSYTNGIYYKLSIHSYLANEFEWRTQVVVINVIYCD